MDRPGRIAYRLLPAQGLCWFRGRGTIDFDQLIRHIQQVGSDPGFRDDLVTLVDFVGATVAYDAPAMERYRHFFNALASERRDGAWAILTDSDLTFASARMAHLLTNSDGIAVKVFRDRSEALAWLGQRPDTLDELTDPLDAP